MEKDDKMARLVGTFEGFNEATKKVALALSTVGLSGNVFRNYYRQREASEKVMPVPADAAFYVEGDVFGDLKARIYGSGHYCIQAMSNPHNPRKDFRKKANVIPFDRTTELPRALQTATAIRQRHVSEPTHRTVFRRSGRLVTVK